MAGGRATEPLPHPRAALAWVRESQPPPSTAQVATSAGSSAAIAPQLDLVLTADPRGHTYLSRQRVGYPFHLGRSLYVPGDPPGMPTLYVQSCSGGIFEEDRLAWRVVASEGARAHLTNAASTIVHTMEAGHAVQQVELEAHAGTYLEYLPDPMILFRDARVTSSVRLRAHSQAVALVSDALVTHDPLGAGQAFDWISAQIRVEDLHGTLLACDRFRLTGTALSQAVPGVTNAFRCLGGFVALCPGSTVPDLVDALRAALPATEEVYAGASRLPSDRGVWVRVLGRDAADLRWALRSAWYAARRVLVGAEPTPRRK